MKYRAKITSKGQVTLPKEMRDKIGIDTGSYIEIKETEAGYLINKQVDDDCLKRYIGILNKGYKAGSNKTSSDDIIREIRGE